MLSFKFYKLIKPRWLYFLKHGVSDGLIAVGSIPSRQIIAKMVGFLRYGYSYI